ncbi:MAG: hypothetical protein KC486_20170, partial [Myxococcales bacterium]|nr:hypothetical protein [Myxococcales bacterium]
MNQPKPSPNPGGPGIQPGPAGPGGTIVNPAAQQAPIAGQPGPGYAPAASPHQGYAPPGQQHHGYQGYAPPGQQHQGYAPAASPAPPQGHHGYAPAASPVPPQGHHGYAPAASPAPPPQPGGYSPYPGVAMPKGYPTTAGQPAHGQHQAQQHAGAPKSNRNDELETGGARTVYEFSGAAAGAGDKRTFVGSLDSMPDLGTTERSERSTNLKSGASSWVLILIGVAVVGGGLTFLTMTKSDEPEPEPAPVAAPAEDGKKTEAAATAAEPTADDAAKKAEEE